MEIQGGNIISQIKHLSDRIFERILAQKNKIGRASCRERV